MNKNTTLLSGAVLLDKPAGPTSHDAVQKVRQLAGGRQVGHAGTLDPLAEGLLLVAFGSATRLLDYAHAWPKTYEARLRLGATSTTDDAGGIIMDNSAASPVNLDKIQDASAHFTGTYEQVPPVYAAVKTDGKKLYEYAREDIGTAQRKAGEKRKLVTIYSIAILKYDWPALSLRITCGSGTYIRALARDLGALIGCGAYLTYLRRTKLGNLNEAQAVKLNELDVENLAAHIMPPEILVSHLPQVVVDPPNVAKLRQGRPVPYSSKTTAENSAPIAIKDTARHLIGLARLDIKLNSLVPYLILS